MYNHTASGYRDQQRGLGSWWRPGNFLGGKTGLQRRLLLEGISVPSEMLPAGLAAVNLSLEAENSSLYYLSTLSLKHKEMKCEGQR